MKTVEKPALLLTIRNLFPALFVLVACLGSSAAQAQFTYVTDNGAITITGYAGAGGAVTIPAIINGLPVTSLGQLAFAGNRSLISVTIPNSMISIEGQAFLECTSLTNVTVPNSVTSIGNGAFYDCASLTAITVGALNANYSSPEGVLFDKSQSTLIQYPGGKMGSYIVPDRVTSIRTSAFANCTTLTSVIIPNGVTSIGIFAFSGCTSLTTVTIPNSVTIIDGGAFIGCTSLTNAMIGNSVSSIGYGAFANCTSLTSVTIANSVTSIGDLAFANCTSLAGVTIPNSVTSIGNSAFDRCTSLTSVTIGNGVTSIGRGAFGGCTVLTSVTIPNSATSIGDAAFGDCSSLTNITIGNSVTTIGNNTFQDCTGLTSVTIPNSVKSIGGGAFWRCTGLTSLTLPDRVTSIGEIAFQGCTGLTSVTIPNSVTSIGNGAFYGCTGLTAITVGALNANYSSLDGVLLDKSQGTLIQYPGGKTGSYLLPNSVASIQNSAFDGCTSLTGVTIGNRVTDIGYAPFYGCTGLAAITVDALNPVYSSLDGVLFDKSQDTMILYPAGKTGSYLLPNNVTSIEVTAFNSPTSLTSIIVGALNPAYSSLDGVLFDKNQDTLILYPDAKTGSYIVPNSVTSIGDYAFNGCTGLTSVTIPNSTTSIGDGAFRGCTDLTSVYFMGNAPNLLSDGWFVSRAFLGDPATIYYLPGTTGWDSTFGDRPTALWTLPYPLILNSSSKAWTQSNPFGFTVSWATNRSVIVEASMNLSNPVWQPLQTNTLTGGTFNFTDPQWTNYSSRLYRLRSQ